MQASPKNIWLLLILLCFSVFLVSLYQAPVPTVDGSIRADEAREIVRTGQWFPIQSLGETVTDHPPLYVWLQAISFKVFGITDFAANLPERFFACLCLILVYLLGIQVGFSWVAALTSVFVLIATRDFILSSVRGYIESMLTCFSYAALYFVLRKNSKWAFLGGIAVFLAFFSKGPPALWPLIFVCVYLLWKKSFQNFIFLLFGFITSVLIFTVWNESGQYWKYWNLYLYNQVLSSALGGRHGAQMFEPFYFLHILWVYYWPWLPLLIASCLYKIKNDKSRILFAIFGIGFFLGFSAVKWKFWYYIAPAYPAFALCIGKLLSDVWEDRILKIFNVQILLGFNIIWILSVFVFKIPLYFERVPAVMDFKHEILRSDSKINVYMIHSFLDHNMVGTSGKWYFDRPVYKITDEDELKWYGQIQSKKNWIITSARHFTFCQKDRAPPQMRVWCKKSKLIRQIDDAALLMYTPE